MKKILVLNIDYFNPKGLSKEELIDKQQKLFNASVELFKNQLGEFIKTLKIIDKNSEKSEITIEFSDVVWNKLYEKLLQSDAVSIIDSII